MALYFGHGDEVVVEPSAAWNTKWYIVVPLVTFFVACALLAGLIYISKLLSSKK